MPSGVFSSGRRPGRSRYFASGSTAPDANEAAPPNNTNASRATMTRAVTRPCISEYRETALRERDQRRCRTGGDLAGRTCDPVRHLGAAPSSPPYETQHHGGMGGSPCQSITTAWRVGIPRVINVLDELREIAGRPGASLAGSDQAVPAADVALELCDQAVRREDAGDALHRVGRAPVPQSGGPADC